MLIILSCRDLLQWLWICLYTLRGWKVCHVKCHDKRYHWLSWRVSSGQVSNVAGATSAVYCQQCSPGKYFEGKGATSSSECTLCPNGTWSGSGFPACTVCPTGKSSPKKSVSADQCVLCSAGKYYNSSSLSCILCPKGYFTDTPGKSV